MSGCSIGIAHVVLAVRNAVLNPCFGSSNSAVYATSTCVRLLKKSIFDLVLYRKPQKYIVQGPCFMI